jgi:type II secretory pathway component HofQ
MKDSWSGSGVTNTSVELPQALIRMAVTPSIKTNKNLRIIPPYRDI